MRSRRRDDIKRVQKLVRISEQAWNEWAMQHPQANFSEWIENKLIQDNNKI